ncbi:unnamed protein product [Nippostrongylus brasiliensis]|uniref:Porin n=1 Tax=Nippostrongylus brasiliensis TaxID=27835 RepID=A0A0N4XKX2_NIPBR|nr:hypothetical protein Q1695_010649 [Nippostrongylus brasiliensis]VDL66764.1 unnamed protein product [Nippostrongylus brasiliensis]
MMTSKANHIQFFGANYYGTVQTQAPIGASYRNAELGATTLAPPSTVPRTAEVELFSAADRRTTKWLRKSAGDMISVAH